MALLWCDGFDHYGTDSANMTDGAWAQLDSGSISAVNPRTGTYSRLRQSGTQNGNLRRVFGAAKTTVGVGGAFWLSELPSNNNRFLFYEFRDASNATQVQIVLQSTGVIEAFRGSAPGSGVLLASSGTPAITAEAFTHIECAVTMDNTVGEVEVRVNGVTVLSASNVDTVNTGNVETSQVVFFTEQGTGLGSNTTVDNTYLDDLFAWDDTGSYNNDFIGDRRVLTQFPDEDTLQADWSVTGAVNGYDAINEPDPDDDTSYISAAAGISPSPESEFEMEDLPAGVSSISAVVVVNRQRKTDAGTANVQASLVSGASEQAGADNAITEAYTYYHDVVEADPDTAAPFTVSGFNAAKLKVTRTA